MRFLFKFRANSEVGSGHLVRCGALASELRRRGAEVHFETDAIHSDASIPIHRKMPEGLRFDWVVFDDYALQKSDESVYRQISDRVLVLDDHGVREHDADLIVDPSVSTGSSRRRARNPMVSFHAGADYLILRPEFVEARKSVVVRSRIKNVLVFFGGTDLKNLTTPLIVLLRNPPADLKDLIFHILISDLHPGLDALKKIEHGENCVLHFSPENVSRLMLECDAYLGSGGTITWERMCLGLTGIVLSVVDNQVDQSSLLEAGGYHGYAGSADVVSMEAFLQQLSDLHSDAVRLKEWSEKSLQLVDGGGVTRICDLITGFNRL